MDKPDRSDYFASGTGLRVIKKDGTVFTVPLPVEKKQTPQAR